MPKKADSLKKWQQNNRKVIVGIVGFCLSIFGVLCGMFWEQIFNGIMEKEMILRPNSEVYDKWKSPPMTLSLDIYLYNWTNPEDFKNLSTKPNFEQLGPYRFTEKQDKVNIQWNPANASVTYRKKSDFYFDAKGSNGSLDDVIVTLNAVALSAAGKAKRWNPVRRNLVDVGLKLYGQEMSITRTIDEMLFTGYSDDMLDMARAMPLFGKDVEVPFDKFGWFYTRNGSTDLTGVFNVYTGADDISKIGQMHTWNYKHHTGYFQSTCGLVNGSAGEFHPPYLKQHGSVSFFTPDLCRTVPLDYLETAEIEGLFGYKYHGGVRSVDNGTLYPENTCFCGGQCVPSGVMNISSCRFGSPVFMSFPHFYNADPYYVQQVDGMQPEQDKHEFYMILEPRTGVALEVAARFQVNMLVEPIKGITLYENVPRVFFPLIWFEQKVRITPDLAADLQLLPKVLMGGQIFACICFGVGLILLCWYPIELLWTRQRSVDLKSTPTTVENGKQLAKFSSVEELKNRPPPVVTANNNKTLDSSPLLERGNGKSATIVSKSETNESVATDKTAVSNVAKE
ncbi:protein peste-like [Anastrepha obliqua]|uniref:protein peste-like n=1 Tax=Anastrepha obliqua TaxID=95512 RepID=UPI002409B15A|nr:protein peste-like [Anastrepha obliqua]XP_054741989.1 protein peste-like [Anastrepha obliqua]XP_054741990.1 protein peste-like [Anastrepha obliqua]